jgi:Mrp family chromosome partitioning ATPase
MLPNTRASLNVERAANSGSRITNAFPSFSTLLVASGKGGVGTSIVAALTAMSAAERGERVLLIDASEGSGTLHHLFASGQRTVWMLPPFEQLKR